MPLPEGGKTPWPPAHCEPINRQIAEWAAWYSGDADQLAAIYGGDQQRDTTGFFASETGGLKATARRVADHIRRWFWGQRSLARSQPRNRLHVPLAGDIASTSADLLFSEPPAVTVDTPERQPGQPEQQDPTQARLDDLLDDGTQAMLLEAAEIAAALGGAYLRVIWDTQVRDQPWLSTVHPDAAVPEWQKGKLTAVTFWRVVKRQGRFVWRHLERHEPGKILHGLYQGEEDELGHPVPLTESPDTSSLAKGLTNGNEVPTGTNMLTAVYVPNMRPNRIWRNNPHAAPLGRSDYAGVEMLLDALDLTYSSWMRDVELGKARLVVPAEYLRSNGPGQGASFDLDQEVYEGINTMGGDEAKPAIEKVQFDIRVEAHAATVMDLKRAIVGSAGYSGQSFGLVEGDTSVTATEVASRDRKSMITRDRKIRYWRPALGDILHVLLEVDRAVFGSAVKPQRPQIEWAPGVSVDPEAQARALQALESARAMSTEQKVRTLHPDWANPEVAEEVARIHGEHGVAVEDPDTFRGTDRPPEGVPTGEE